MLRRYCSVLILTLVLAGLSVGVASAATDMPDGTVVTQPPTEMSMDGMEGGMSREMMMSDIQTWVSALPPGISNQIMPIVCHLPDDQLMMLHYEMNHTGLLSQPPGLILLFVQNFGHSGH